ncbi:MAG: hypothetical protein HC921_21935 [Synechococcaceae cyanobacterium SM2_3_1]|nr:hypothetical protein [Synechococcaceae cyanobacterium SM2_3_1]
MSKHPSTPVEIATHVYRIREQAKISPTPLQQDKIHQLEFLNPKEQAADTEQVISNSMSVVMRVQKEVLNGEIMKYIIFFLEIMAVVMIFGI